MIGRCERWDLTIVMETSVDSKPQRRWTIQGSSANKHYEIWVSASVNGRRLTSAIPLENNRRKQ